MLFKTGLDGCGVKKEKLCLCVPHLGLIQNDSEVAQLKAHVECIFRLLLMSSRVTCFLYWCTRAAKLQSSTISC